MSNKRWYNKATVYRLIRLGIISTFIIVLFIILPGTSEWCNASLGAGECEKYMNKSCYCIDAFTSAPNQSDGLFERAQARCSKLGGYLATPDQNSLLIWLSKRLFMMGVDTALVGLTKIASVWTWVTPKGNKTAGEIPWRDEFPPSDNHAHGTINVKTREVKIKDDGGYYLYDYIYYNYDYYLDENPNYQWFGFSTSSNIHDDDVNLKKSDYYICYYGCQNAILMEPNENVSEEKPANIISNDDEDNEIKERPEDSLLSDISDILQNDPCYCSADEQIKLSELDDSQTFQSPKYPSNYCSDANCRWIIRTPDNLAVSLEWLVFNIETNMDYVYVYDAETDDFRTPLIETCTGSRCKNQISSGNSMQVQFKSDHVTTDLGFKVRVTAVKTDTCYCSPLSVVTLANVGESYQLNSPNQPNPYCQNHNCTWTIKSPNNYGLQLVWVNFDTEKPKDKLFIHDGHEFIEKCTGSSCKGFTSFADEIHLQFISDNKETKHSGFSALVVVTQNFCEKPVVENGVASYSKERNDGNIPMEASATLECDQDYWIFLQDSTKPYTSWEGTCIGPKWSEEKSFPKCVRACTFTKSTTAADDSNLYFCDYGHPSRDLIESAPDGYELIVQHTKQGAINNEVFTCRNASWYPHSPKCHAIGIVFFGSKTELAVVRPNVEVYSPALNDFYLLDLPMPYQYEPEGLGETIYHHASVMLGDGTMMVIINFKTEKTKVSIIDFKTKKTKHIAPLMTDRYGMAVAVLNDTVFACGGEDAFWAVPLRSCEKLRNREKYWRAAGTMNYVHKHGAMVTMDNALYISGGEVGSYSDAKKINKVERYDVSADSWGAVAAMLEQRSYHASTASNGRIYVCGGSVEYKMPITCEEYNPNLNEWLAIASMNHEQGRYLSLHVLNGKIWAIGQAKTSPGYGPKTYDQTVKSYDTEKKSWIQKYNSEMRNRITNIIIDATVVLPVISHDRTQWSFDASYDEVLRYFCEIPVVDNGVVSYSENSIDGLLPLGTSATLTCDVHSRIYTNNGTTTDTHNATCEAPNWKEPFPTCITTACKLVRKTTAMDDTDLYLCDYEKSIVSVTENVPSGSEIKVQHHQNKAITEEIFSCHNTTWYPRKPICHLIGIMISTAVDPTPEGLSHNIEIYSPILNEFYFLDMTYKEIESDAQIEASVALPDGRVMLITNNADSSILDLKTKQKLDVPSSLDQRTWTASIQWKNSVYVCGGHDVIDYENTLNNCMKFTDGWTWTYTTNMTYARHSAAIAAMHDALYISGGDKGDYSCTIMDKVERYDISTDTWQELAPMLQQRNGHASTVFNGQIYVCGGSDCLGRGIQPSILLLCEQYNPNLDQWIEFAPLHQQWEYISMHVFIGKLWVIGGYGYGGPVTVESYEPNTKSWTIKAMDEQGRWNSRHSAIVLPVTPAHP